MAPAGARPRSDEPGRAAQRRRARRNGRPIPEPLRTEVRGGHRGVPSPAPGATPPRACGAAARHSRCDRPRDRARLRVCQPRDLHAGLRPALRPDAESVARHVGNAPSVRPSAPSRAGWARGRAGHRSSLRDAGPSASPAPAPLRPTHRAVRGRARQPLGRAAGGGPAARRVDGRAPRGHRPRCPRDHRPEPAPVRRRPGRPPQATPHGP